MFTDSHCHLDPEVYGGEDAVDAVIARARQGGVSRMISIGSGYSLPSAERARAVARRHPDVWFTVGVHPHDAKDWNDDTAGLLASLFADERCVALGEMGLDFHYDMSPRDVQRQVLRDQLRLAIALDAPIVIHDRESQGETLQILDEAGAFAKSTVLYHCYTGDVAHMREITARGGYISIPGIVTFKTAEVMRAVAAEVPEDRLMIETDSPFLTPVPFRGQKNEPARVALVGHKVAELRGASPEAIAELTTRNTLRFFRIET
jgi:TatD DNase family protein